MDVLIGVIITFLVVILVLYLVNMLPLDARARQIVRAIVIIIGVISLLKYLAVFYPPPRRGNDGGPRYPSHGATDAGRRARMRAFLASPCASSPSPFRAKLIARSVAPVPEEGEAR
jgi:hypothetical protein